MPAGVGNGQNADMIGMIFEENNEGIFAHHAPPYIPAHFGKTLGVRTQFHGHGG
jgi:hypothetical protein